MARKWKTAIIIWTGIFLYFGIGSFYSRDADLFLIIFRSVLLLAATIYTIAIWVRDQAGQSAVTISTTRDHSRILMIEVDYH